MNGHAGYAVIDTETTGLAAGLHHRIAEIAIVHTDPSGVVTDEWCTLVDPQRDLGAQAVHGIRAADLRHAPRFADIAGDVIDRVRGRTVVAHNWPFDAMHLRAEFARLGIDTPLHNDAGLCTMRSAGRAMLGAGRSLIDCCAVAGLPDMDWHTARDDAVAAAALLRYLLAENPEAVAPTAEQADAARWDWPRLAAGVTPPVHRTPDGEVEPRFLTRLGRRMPRDDEPAMDSYFAMLDDALLDRQISASEADALVELAEQLGLNRADAVNAHHTYLRELARAAWDDGVITDAERADMHTVATLLGLHPDTADQIVADEHPDNHAGHSSGPSVTPGGLTLRPGDKVVLTGDMAHGRDHLTGQATVAGLRVMGNVSGKTRVVAAADPDTFSGKARKAREIEVPIVSEEALRQALDAMPGQ